MSLILSSPDGQPVTADDMALTHDHKLHVMIVDEGLEDYVHMHPEIGADGLYQVRFTPKFPRTYRVWADYTLAGSEGGDAHGHDQDDDHDHHGASSGDQVIVSEALIVGEEAAPELSSEDVLSASANGLTYELSASGQVKAGESVKLVVTITGPNGSAFAGLEPLMGAYGHLVGFNLGATTMVHAHPGGDHPHGDASRGGPQLEFETVFEEAGPHKLFLQTKTGGSESGIAFILNVTPQAITTITPARQCLLVPQKNRQKI